MNATLTVLTLGMWFLVAQKMPSWSWFVALRAQFPRHLELAWAAATGCLFCGAFWLAAMLKLATGLQTAPELSGLHPLLAFPLDAIGTATLAAITMSLTGPMNLLLQAARAKQEQEQRRAPAATSAAPKPGEVRSSVAPAAAVSETA
jgi:hypothetical protein